MTVQEGQGEGGATVISSKSIRALVAAHGSGAHSSALCCQWEWDMFVLLDIGTASRSVVQPEGLRCPDGLCTFCCWSAFRAIPQRQFPLSPSHGLDRPIQEMKEFCNEAAVQWGLVCFTFGSGTFKRHKNIFVHFNGQNVGAVKRGKFNSQKSDVIDQLGSTHSDIEITSKGVAVPHGCLKQPATAHICCRLAAQTSNRGSGTHRACTVRAPCTFFIEIIYLTPLFCFAVAL